MAQTYSMKGTSNPTFTVGKNGPTIHQGTANPSNGAGNDGDVFVQAGGTPGFWQKIAGAWSKVGAFSSKIFTGTTSVDTSEVADTITMNANGLRVMEVQSNAAATLSEKLNVTNGASKVTMAVSDSSGTNAVDLVVDLQGQGGLKIQSDADPAIRTPDGASISVAPGDKVSGAGGALNLSGGNTSAAGQTGGNIVLTPGTSGAGATTLGQIVAATGYLPSTNDSILTRHQSTVLTTVVVTTLSSHVVTTSENLILVNRSTSSATGVVLPNSGILTGRVVHVKDAKGDAASNNTTVTVAGGALIDGVSSYVINTNYGKAAFVWDGTNWLTI